MAKLFSWCVGKTNALVFLSIVQTLDKITAAYCVCGQVWTDGTGLCLWQAARRPICCCELSIQTWTEHMKFHLTSANKIPTYNMFLIIKTLYKYSSFFFYLRNENYTEKTLLFSSAFEWTLTECLRKPRPHFYCIIN